MANHESYYSLSIKDLLEARDTYHNYLVRLENVAATAIGRKRFRREGVGREEPMRLRNSEVRRSSWPCVLVFVSRWLSPRELSSERRLGQVVPEALVLRDGRVIPTCVVEIEPGEGDQQPETVPFDTPLVGGGYPIITVEQGRTHYGSLACLVSDGSATYGLTCRHVVGEPGREVWTELGGKRVKIGTSARQQLGRKRFAEVYPGWAGEHTWVNIDAGLVRFDDLERTTALVHGIGRVGPIYDMGTETVSLDLIGKPVRGFGGVSGPLSGEIQALFYRYKEVAGAEYVADLLIGPRADVPDALPTLRGDSGTLFFVDEPQRGKPLRPIAMQWGGTTQHKARYVLASFLSTICRELAVDVVHGWNINHFEYWGGRIHPLAAVATLALLPEGRLRTLVERNADTLGELTRVPDLWKPGRGAVKDFQKERQAERPLHYTDMDDHGKGPYARTTLLQLWKDPKKLTREVYAEFLGKHPHEADTAKDEPSTLPFRLAYVWQEMRRYASEGEVRPFLCALGAALHYTFDATCALHLSRYHHGYPAGERPGDKTERGDAIHGDYDDLRRMNLRGDVVRKELLGMLDGVTIAPSRVRSPDAVAHALARMMIEGYHDLDPHKLVDDYIKNGYRLDWKRIEGPTMRALVEGSRLCAALAVSAWHGGDGDRRVKERDLRSFEFEDLAEIWQAAAFLPSDRGYEQRRRAAS